MKTLHGFITQEMRTGAPKRWCAKCDEHVTDQDRTRSIFCRKHRGQQPITAQSTKTALKKANWKGGQ